VKLPKPVQAIVGAPSELNVDRLHRAAGKDSVKALYRHSVPGVTSAPLSSASPRLGCPLTRPRGRDRGDGAPGLTLRTRPVRGPCSDDACPGPPSTDRGSAR
jgi:hypothetical protein